MFKKIKAVLLVSAHIPWCRSLIQGWEHFKLRHITSATDNFHWFHCFLHKLSLSLWSKVLVFRLNFLGRYRGNSTTYNLTNLSLFILIEQTWICQNQFQDRSRSGPFFISYCMSTLWLILEMTIFSAVLDKSEQFLEWAIFSALNHSSGSF